MISKKKLNKGIEIVINKNFGWFSIEKDTSFKEYLRE